MHSRKFSLEGNDLRFHLLFQIDVSLTGNEEKVTFVQDYWYPGWYDIFVHGHNLINSTQNHTTFNVLDPINGLIVNDPGRKILLNEEFSWK